MGSVKQRLLVCNCEKSMKVDGGAIARALDVPELHVHSQLCRAEIGIFEQALAEEGGVFVACTQESPLFAEVAEESGREHPQFGNIRELAGWTADTQPVAPKMAALIAAAALPTKPARLRRVENDGLCLVVGAGQAALDAAMLLNRTLSVTLLLTNAEDVLLPLVLDFPVFSGRVARAMGSLGAFEIVVDGYAPMLPSSRRTPQFALARDGAKSSCSVLFDMSGETALFPRPEGRDGYFRVDPADPVGVMHAVFEASGYDGEFEKPIYVTYDASICAHERSQKTGCTKCLDNCPPGAISPAGDNILVDTAICGGCGNCAAHCPTGAIAYDYPARPQMIARVQTLAQTYLKAGGHAPVLLLHDAGHGAPLINAMARSGRGLPANVIPLELHSATGVGHDLMAAAMAAGFRSVAVLVDPRKAGELHALNEEILLQETLLKGFGLAAARVSVLVESDPDVLEQALYGLALPAEIARQNFAPVGGKRDVARAAIALLAKAGKSAARSSNSPPPRLMGRSWSTARNARCAWPASRPARPMRCATTPKSPSCALSNPPACNVESALQPARKTAISLAPRYNLSPTVMQPVTLNEDEPAECTRCGKAFASRGVLERVKRTLGGKHWMFETDERISLIDMCESCRLEVLSGDGADPFAISQRPKVRTTDDYLEADKKGLSVEDFLSGD